MPKFPGILSTGLSSLLALFILCSWVLQPSVSGTIGILGWIALCYGGQFCACQQHPWPLPTGYRWYPLSMTTKNVSRHFQMFLAGKIALGWELLLLHNLHLALCPLEMSSGTSSLPFSLDFPASFLCLKLGYPLVVSKGDCFFSYILPTERPGGEVVVLLASHCCTETGIFYPAHKNLILWNSFHLVMLFFLNFLMHHPLTDPSFSLIHGRIQYLADPLIPLLNTVLILSVFNIHIDESSNAMASQFLISSSLTF